MSASGARATLTRFWSPKASDSAVGERAALLAALLCYCVTVAVRLWKPQFSEGNHYSAQAASLLRGRLDIIFPLKTPVDQVIWRHHLYLPFPPLPSVLLLPITAIFGFATYEGVLASVFGMVNLFLFQRVLRRAECPHSLRPWLMVLFGLGSLHFYAVVIGGSWLLSHVLAITCILLLLLEALGRCRPELLGFIVGCASLSRPSAAFILPFCFAAGWARGRAGSVLLAHCLRVLLGAFPWCAVWLWYDWVRFGAIFETGYEAISVPRCIGQTLRAHGTFSVLYAPKNLYLLLLQGPEPVGSTTHLSGLPAASCATTTTAQLDAPTLAFPWLRPSEWGMGIFFTTPALLYALFLPRDKWSVACWIAIVCSCLGSITYYSPGWVQFGFRYSLDFLPFMLVLIARRPMLRDLRLFRVVVAASVLIEIWGTSFWVANYYPPLARLIGPV